jgi:YHS domain-containing protein
MMRAILIFLLLMVVYQAVKAVFRSASDAYHGKEKQAPRIPGEEMVQDPQCRTFVVKGRAVARRIGGRTAYFCSESCADAYERDHRAS